MFYWMEDWDLNNRIVDLKRYLCSGMIPASHRNETLLVLERFECTRRARNHD